MSVPEDVQRILGWDELPASVREIPPDYNPLDEGVLMAHQQAWVKLINEEDLCLAEKGRRTGITFATGLDDTITASSSREAGGDNCYYVGDTKDKGLEYIGYCAHMARVMASAMAEGWRGIEVVIFKDQQPDDSTKDITAYRIRFASGFQILALSSNPANIRGLQGIVNIDEAAFHRNVQAVIDAATALIIWGGKIRIISTHNGIKNPFNQLVRDSREGLYAFRVFKVTFDEAVANGLYERVCLIKGWEPTPEGKRQWYERVRGAYGANRAAMLEELDAIPREGSGVVIPGVVIEQCMSAGKPVIRLALDTEFGARPPAYRTAWVADWIRVHLAPLLDQLDETRQHVLGEDYARYDDFTVFAPAAIMQNLVRSVPFMVELHKVPARQQEEILWYIIDRLPQFKAAAMDATGNGATLAEYTADRYGHDRIHQVMLNDAWYRDHMGSFVAAWFDRSLDVSKDADVKNDVRMLTRIDGIVKLPAYREQDTKNAAIKRHGDSAIALVMMWFASEQDGGPIEFESTGRRRAFTRLGRYMGRH